MSSYRRDFFKKLGLLFSGSWLAQPAPAAESAAQRPAPAAESAAQRPAPAAESAAEQAPPQAAAAKTPAPHDQFIKADYDLIVVGGGIAGTTAAISAARNGMKVALVHERSMLGGNSSSEVKLFPENNSGHHPWIKEGGIHDEFHTEERTRNHLPYVEGTMNCHWDLVLYEWVVRETNIALYLNTHMHRAYMKDAAHIRAIEAIQLGTEKTFELSAPLFVDATGDGVLAYRAGADFRWGREAASEYGESLAPARADEKVMGNTLFFRAVDTGRPVPFKLPDWAAGFPTEKDLTARGHSYIEGGYWWIEVGAPHHPIHGNEAIRHEALRQLLGVWDHIKNRGNHKAENYGLEFVGFWPYKRECRRILGDYVLTQEQVQNPKALDDAVAYGCWGIDIHVQGGILARSLPPYPPPGAYWETLGSAVYGIPLRALYSRNIRNLLMAGRPISGSYLAFASSRVLSTGCIVGQAVGVAAALCKKHNVSPRDVAHKHAAGCRQLILRQDGHIPGVVNEDPGDLARQAHASASSEWRLEFPEGQEARELTIPHAQIFPVSAGRLDRVELLLQSKLATPAEVRVGLRAATHVWDFRSTQDLAEARTEVPARTSGWVSFPLNAVVEPNKLYYLYTDPQPGIFWRLFTDKEGEPNRTPVAVSPANRPGPTRWRPITGGRSLCMRIAPDSRPYTASNVTRGANRPDLWSNIWISDPAQDLPAWLLLEWRVSRQFNTVQITFDTDASRRVILPLFRYPDCVRDYAVEARGGGAWQTIVEVKDNYFRRRVHRFERIRADALRLQVQATNGAHCARVYEVRVYDEA